MRSTRGGEAAARTVRALSSGRRTTTAGAISLAAFAGGASAAWAESGWTVGTNEQQSRWTARIPGPSAQQACVAAADCAMQVDRQTATHEMA
jgi:hypothetical protein